MPKIVFKCSKMNLPDFITMQWTLHFSPKHLLVKIQHGLPVSLPGPCLVGRKVGYNFLGVFLPLSMLHLAKKKLHVFI